MALSKDQGNVSRTPKAWSTNRGFMVVKPGLPGHTIRTKRLVNQSIPGKPSHSNNKKNQAVVNRICYVLEIFSQACVRSSKEKTLQEFREFLEDKSLDNSDLLRFYEQNMFEYKQGLAPPAVKGSLKGTHPVLGRYWGTSLGVREH